MRLSSTSRLAITAIALLATGLGIANAFASSGGLAVTPGILEHVARPGGIGSLEVSNTTRRPMKIAFAVRPWAQARSGSVSPDRRRLLGSVRPDRGGFWLAPGAGRSLALSLVGRPAHGSLYGAIEATGAPKYRGGRGIRVAYRLVTSLRLNPPKGARRFRARAGRLFEHGTTRHGTLFLAVRNTGNTIVPIGGRVYVSGHRHTLTGVVFPKAILPGATVNLRLARLRGTLPRGRYDVTIRLTQGRHRLGTVRRRGVRLR